MTAQEAIEVMKWYTECVDHEIMNECYYGHLRAIEALEKQIPKDCKRIGATQLKCICGSVIKLHRYCPYCGQKLDWSEQNERT